ncbi:MAG: hypothetical protein JOZ45_00430 [Acidobacteriaceae bacterium]|nr:hypothetical protein [Acidobacteriaceae bacterium]
MCPLILNKEKRKSRPMPDPSFDSEWMQTVANHCRLAQESLAVMKNDALPNGQALRSLIHEEVPALLENLERWPR